MYRYIYDFVSHEINYKKCMQESLHNVWMKVHAIRINVYTDAIFCICNNQIRQDLADFELLEFVCRYYVHLPVIQRKLPNNYLIRPHLLKDAESLISSILTKTSTTSRRLPLPKKLEQLIKE